MTDKTGTKLMHEALPQVARLDAAMDEIIRIVDNHATAMNLAQRYGNQYGDQDRVNATRGMIEEVIRRLVALK